MSSCVYLREKPRPFAAVSLLVRFLDTVQQLRVAQQRGIDGRSQCLVQSVVDRACKGLGASEEVHIPLLVPRRPLSLLAAS